MRMMRLACALLILAAGTPHAVAMQLFHRETLAGYRAASLAFDPWICGLWVANESPQLVLLSLAGTEIMRVDTPLSNVRAVTADADGLIVTNGRGAFARLGRQGEGMGRDWDRTNSQLDVEGLHRHPEGGLLTVGDDAALVQWLDETGAERFRIEGYKLVPMMAEPQGIGVDPITGNILVVDDNEGLNALFEFDSMGNFLSITPLSEWGWDAEAVAVHHQTGTLWIGYDSGTAIAVFDYLPTRTPGAAPLDPGPDCAIS
jgi:DNA-binding beta-propeller fold protein YncE